MDLTLDAFQALARSSPWRWRSLHLRHRNDRSPDVVEAWIARPGRMHVKAPEWPRARVVEQKLSDHSWMTVYASDDVVLPQQAEAWPSR